MPAISNCTVKLELDDTIKLQLDEKNGPQRNQ
jgi:hypothetical protein